MFDEIFMDVLAHEGVVSITSWADNDAHVVNTWNKSLQVFDGNKLLIPAAGMRKTQRNVDINANVKLTVGSHEVMGLSYMGTGFLVDGTATFLMSGEEYDMMKEKFPYLTRVLEITVSSVKRTQ